MMDRVLSDRYEIQRQLGKKSGRRTLLACDRTNQELVVIKILSFGSDFEWDDLKLFEREAQTLLALSHPAIPRYRDRFEIDSPNGKGFALVQSYIEAQSLEEQLKAGRTFSEAEVEEIAKTLLEILIYLHGQKPPVIHRDIKPSNILLTNRSAHSVGQVYLVDFGSVQTLTAKEGSTITVVGTYGYMPLEQFGGRAVPASDLYSLGATLIYLITGTHPADLPQKEGRIQFEQIAHLSPNLANWLRRMTNPSLERRLTSAREALQELEQPQPSSSTLLKFPRGDFEWNENNWLTKKPSNSKIILNKESDYLEIIIPPSGFNLKIAIMSFLEISLIYWLFLNFGGQVSLVSTLLFVPYLIPILLMGEKIIFALFGRYRVKMTRWQVYKIYELFGLKFNISRPARTQEITKMEFIGGFLSRDDQRNERETHPRIIIWAGAQKFEFGGSLITEPELEWLAEELSSWLQLPITRK